MVTWLDGSGLTRIASAPDTAGLSHAGDLDHRAIIAPNDWTIASVVVAKRSTPDASQGEWEFLVGDTAIDADSLRWWSAAAVNNYEVGGTPPSDVNGEWTGVRVTLQVDDGSSQHVVRYYRCYGVGPTDDLDALVWSQIASDTVAGVTDVRDVATLVELGGRGNNFSVFLAGKFAKAQIRKGDGTVMGSPDFTNLAPGAVDYTDAQGNVWTFGSGAGIGDSDFPAVVARRNGRPV